jgi:hypothetical protein
VRNRFAHTLGISSLLIALISGCTFTAEIANLEPYDPSDGVGATLEDVAVRNAMLITSDGGEANLVMTVVNSSGEDTELVIQFGEGDARKTATLVLPAQPELTQVGTSLDNQLVVEDDNIIAGALFPVYFQHGDVQGEKLNVPVLDGTLAEYELLVP